MNRDSSGFTKTSSQNCAPGARFVGANCPVVTISLQSVVGRPPIRAARRWLPCNCRLPAASPRELFRLLCSTQVSNVGMGFGQVAATKICHAVSSSVAAGLVGKSAQGSGDEAEGDVGGADASVGDFTPWLHPAKARATRTDRER